MKITEFNPNENGRLSKKVFFRFCLDQTAMVIEVIRPPKIIRINVKIRSFPLFFGCDTADRINAETKAIILKISFIFLVIR